MEEAHGTPDAQAALAAGGANDLDIPEANLGADNLIADEEDPLNLPPHGTEVFIGGIHRSTTEDQLRDFGSQVGEVYSVKLVKDPANPEQNRGYGFVKFVTKEGALTAMDRLVDKELADYPGHKVRVAPAQAKNKLYVGNIPHDMNKEGLEQALNEVVKGIERIDMVMSKENPSHNRGFVFIEFYNNACAQHAKNTLSNFKLGDRTLNVDFAEPTARDPMQSGVKSIFVGNLTAAATEDNLRELFSQYGEVEKVNLPRPREGETHPKYGFIHFTERVAAAKAVEAEQKPELDGVQLAVKYGKTDDHKQGGGGFGGGRGGRGGRGGGRYGGQGGYGYQGYGGGGGGYGGMGGMQMAAPGMMMGGNGLVPVLPVTLPNGQVAYMLQQGGGMQQGGQGGWGGQQGGRGGGYGGGYGRGGGRGRGRGGPRYQPY